MISSPTSSTSARPAITAALHLKAVLPCMEDLARLSPEARAVISGWNLRLRFTSLRGGPTTNLDIQNDTITSPFSSASTDLPTLSVVFSSPQQVVNMFENKGVALPLPVGNPLHMPRLMEFKKLADLLQQYLRPSTPDLDDEAFLRNHATMLLGLMTRACAVLTTSEEESHHLMQEGPRGTALFCIKELEPCRWIRWNGSKCSSGNGEPDDEPDVRITFRNPQILFLASQQQLDPLATVGKGDVTVEGLVPLADTLSLVMDRISLYLEN